MNIPAIKPINSRSKGKTGEREAITVLQEIIAPVYAYVDKEPPVLRRNLSQARAGGFDVVGLDGYAIEVKRASRRAAVDTWWLQTLRQAGDCAPVLMWRLDRQQWRFRILASIVCSGKAVVHVPVELGRAEFGLWLQTTIYNDFIVDNAVMLR